MSCCGGKRSTDSLECHSSMWGEKPPEDCMEVPIQASPSPRKTLSLSCLKSKSKVSLAEKDYESLQLALFTLTSHFAKIQFRLRQIIQAQPSERDRLLFELVAVAFCGAEEFKCDGLPQMEKDFVCLGNIRRRQGNLIRRLRGKMDLLSKQTVPDKPDEDSEDDKSKKKNGKNEKQKKGEKQSKTKPEKQKQKKKSRQSSNESFEDSSLAEIEIESMTKKGYTH